MLSSESLTKEDQHELLTVIDEETDRLNRLIAHAVEMVQLDTQRFTCTCSRSACKMLCGKVCVHAQRNSHRDQSTSRVIPTCHAFSPMEHGSERRFAI
jgi:K+-sensing histidine kinase KdpD